MKTTSNYLFHLIHSMTRNEKGYFKKQVLAHNGVSNEVQYLKIFDAIDKQSAYNEEELLEKFKEEKFISQFSVAKNYLISLVLKALAQFHSGKSVESILRRQLDFSHVLFVKGFYKESKSELSKAKKMAYQFDKHDYTLAIIKKEKQLMASLKNESMVNELQSLLEEEEKVQDTLGIENELSVVYYQFLNEIHTNRIRNSLVEYGQLHALRRSLPDDGSSFLITFNSRNYYYGIETIYNYLINDFSRAAHFGKLHRQLWEGNEERFKDENDDYLEIIYHYISACFQLRNHAEVNECLEKIKKLETDTYDKKQRNYFIYYTSRLRYYASLALYDDAKKLLDEIELHASEALITLNPAYRITLCINCAITYFVLEDYRRALQWLNSYLNNLNKDFRKDAFSFARIFNLFIHYKLGNSDLLEHVIKNTYRQIRSQDQIFEYEKAILLFIKKIAKKHSRKSLILFAQQLQGQLRELESNPIEHYAMRYFDFISWLESEIRKVPYRLQVERNRQE